MKDEFRKLHNQILLNANARNGAVTQEQICRLYDYLRTLCVHCEELARRLAEPSIVDASQKVDEKTQVDYTRILIRNTDKSGPDRIGRRYG